jgi:hypothetical protein
MSNGNNEAKAYPTKQFFVSMLTRDIKLEDSILDLLDNCLDGALRAAKGAAVDYSKHGVSIVMSETTFEIEDNCGGIPRDVAVNYAFKMGREADDTRDAEDETIGMYGVGMKRAIFKMGETASVQTLNGEDSFEVKITPDWLKEKEWKSLPIQNLTGEIMLPEPGTRIIVTNLYSGVVRHFTSEAFINELRKSIAEHFTMFLQRGFRVLVNEKPVEPVRVEVLVSNDLGGPAPYVYETTIDDVRVSIAVGLNTGNGQPSDDEDSSDFERDRSAATAGWTVFCNDRAVIVGDKSRLTGWGDKLPLYHYQFSIITGIVEFRSHNAERLPVTTTKRALDASSDVWLQALVKMKEGMRLWVNYTNAWKNHPDNRVHQAEHWKSAKALPIRKVIENLARRPESKHSGGVIEFNPVKQHVMPMPASKTPTSRRIVFSKPIEEIRLVSECLFEKEDEQPGTVGEKCFEIVLQQCAKGKGRR